jgi:hypothetical protein
MPAMSPADPARSGRALVALLLALLVLLAQAVAAPALAAGEERRVALVIGNAAYRHADPLANPLNDARAVAAKLRQIGFAEVMVETDRGIDAMQRALRAFAGLAEGADLAVVSTPGTASASTARAGWCRSTPSWRATATSSTRRSRSRWCRTPRPGRGG